jgi:hypothetical protein
MKSICHGLLPLCVFLSFVTAAVAAPQIEYQNYGTGGDAGGGGSCQVCSMVQQNNSISMSCAGAQSGNWGAQYCRIESYPEGSYCFTDGDSCCVD